MELEAAGEHEHWLAGNIPGWTAQNIESAIMQSRYLSNEGRLFFNSPDELVPAATNHKEDVYEYEPSGLGSCESSTGGCVSLVSSGTSSHESAFLEATPDGGEVFFISAAQLLPQDADTAFDIYDARVCTALSPCLTPPTPGEGPCSSEASCRPAPAAVQAPTAPAGSATVTPQDNPISPSVPPAAKHAAKGTKTTKPLTRAQKLAAALKACRKQRSKHKRQACERRARKRYGPLHRTKHKAKRAVSPHATTRGTR